MDNRGCFSSCAWAGVVLHYRKEVGEFNAKDIFHSLCFSASLSCIAHSYSIHDAVTRNMFVSPSATGY
jgi:hypothetical protein